MNKNIKTEIGIGIIVVILIILGGLIWFGDREEKQILETTLQLIKDNENIRSVNLRGVAREIGEHIPIYIIILIQYLT